jgi:hypothetical protein
MLSRLSVLGSLLSFTVQGNRKFWLLPLVLSLLIVLILIVFGSVSALAPFLYPLF